MTKREQLVAALAVFALLFTLGNMASHEPRLQVPDYEYTSYGWPLPWLSQEQPLKGNEQARWEILWFGLVFDVAVLVALSGGVVTAISRYRH